MKFKAIVEYEYPIDHKPPVKAEIVLHGDRVITDNIKWIEQEQKTRWIPVIEGLPDNNDDVLVYDYSDIFVAWYSGIDGNWCSADNRFDEYTPIIAWQPLPAPYKPQKSDNCN